MAQEKVMDLIQNEQFLKKAFRQALIPCILSILSGDINILVDGILVGQRLGDAGLAAINLSMPVYQVLCVLGSFLVSGTAISASREMGRDDMERARTLCKQAQTLCLLVSVATTVLGLLFLQPLSRFLCSNESIRPMMTDYVEQTGKEAQGETNQGEEQGGGKPIGCRKKSRPQNDDGGKDPAACHTAAPLPTHQ